MARMRRDQRKKAKKEAIAVSNVTSASGPSEFEASAVGTPVPEISEMKPVMIAMAVEDHESSPDPDKTSPAVDKKKARGKKGKLFADMV